MYSLRSVEGLGELAVTTRRRGPKKAGQPTVGKWLTLVTVGIHRQGLYADLAGPRVVTIENLMEDADGR